MSARQVHLRWSLVPLLVAAGCENNAPAPDWQERILQDYLDFTDFDKFAIKHSEVLATPGLNPYRLGYLLYKDIERRWDEMEGKGAGLEKIFEIRKHYDDIHFIREFLTQEICEDCGLYVFDRPGGNAPGKIKSTKMEDVKQKLMSQLINFGKPVIVVKEFETPPDEELHLYHKFDGRELNVDHATDVLKALYRIWNKPIHLETIIRGERSFISFDGENQSISKAEAAE